ncbi:MAG TPA: hypothetical protein VK934_09805, partial [Fimbriimonas sp.]|nr:hypothetical protein [Fimbriimonas sp.]
LSALLGGAFAFASGQLGSSRVSSAALGLAAGMCCHFAPDYALTNAQAMMLAVLGIGAIVTGSYAAAIAAVLVVALDSFGKMTEGSESLAFAGSLGGILLLVAAMPFICRKAPGWSVPALGGILLLIFYFVPSFLQPVAPTLLIGLVGAIVLHVLLPSDSDATPLNAGIGTIIAVGLATASYALFKGTGMAACLLGCAGVLLLMQNPRALLATGPLFGLVLFRLLRNLYPETSRAFDIGQHYALIGLLIGAILPIILIDALPVTDRAGRRQPVALFILGLVLAATAPLLTMFLGPLGIVGFVVGLGFAGIFELIRNGSSLLALSAGSGMAGVLFLTFGALEKSVDFAREEKIRLLVWAAAGILLASAAFALLTKKVKE